MASQQEIIAAINTWTQQHPGQSGADAIRRQKIAALKVITGRPILIYASDFISPRMTVTPQLQGLVSISLRDKDFFPDVVDSIDGERVDFVVQSPGGSAEAVETIVALLRKKFTDIRVLVPGTAKSAATMLAMCANDIAMDDLSELGPTDPQMFVNGRYNPAGAIRKQFQLGVETLKADKTALTAWLPILQMFAPALLMECEHHLQLSKDLVGSWLEQYMFAGDADAKQKATAIAEWLSEDDNFYTHARRVSMIDLIRRGVKVLDLNDDAPLRDAVRDLYYAIMATFETTNCFKLFENSEGHCVVLQANVQVVQAPQPAPPPTPAPAPTAPAP